MPNRPIFRKLNEEWNAEPNAPAPVVERAGDDLVVRFFLNPFKYKQFAEEDRGTLRFVDCCRYRLGPDNDEGWWRGQCRYRAHAPAWGNFYEISGDDPHLDEPTDWRVIKPDSRCSRHFLFYFRDGTFECVAMDWLFEPDPDNPLFRYFQSKIA